MLKTNWARSNGKNSNTRFFGWRKEEEGKEEREGKGTNGVHLTNEGGWRLNDSNRIWNNMIGK